jgi:hypothetical protein
MVAEAVDERTDGWRVHWSGLANVHDFLISAQEPRLGEASALSSARTRLALNPRAQLAPFLCSRLPPLPSANQPQPANSVPSHARGVGRGIVFRAVALLRLQFNQNQPSAGCVAFSDPCFFLSVEFHRERDIAFGFCVEADAGGCDAARYGLRANDAAAIGCPPSQLRGKRRVCSRRHFRKGKNVAQVCVGH